MSFRCSGGCRQLAGQFDKRITEHLGVGTNGYTVRTARYGKAHLSY